MQPTKNFDILSQLDAQSNSELSIDITCNDYESSFYLFGANVLAVVGSASITYKDSYMCMCTSGAKVTTSWQKLNEHEGQFTTHICAPDDEYVTYAVFSKTHSIDNANAFRDVK